MFFLILKFFYKKKKNRDLKPENILLKYPDDDSSLKIIDFGNCQFISEEEIIKKL